MSLNKTITNRFVRITNLKPIFKSGPSPVPNDAFKTFYSARADEDIRDSMLQEQDVPNLAWIP